MKKNLLICLVSLCCAGVAANAQTSVGIHGSVISSTFKYKSSVPGTDLGGFAKSRASFRVGLMAIASIGETFAVIPQLNFVSTGTKLDGTTSFTAGTYTGKVSVKGSVKPSFMELPVHLGISRTMDNGARFFAGVGPSLNVGIGGKYDAVTVTEATGTPTETEHVKGSIKFDGKKAADVNDDAPHFKRVTFGGSAVAGYQLPVGLFVQAHYHLGLSSLSPDKDESYKSNYAGIGIGYIFGGGK